MKVIPLDADAHFAVRALLPWYATGRLATDEAAQVETHLAGCAICRAELELERRMVAAQPVSTTAADVEHGWAAMRKLIRSEPRSSQAASTPWLRWVVGAQFAIIGILAVWLLVPRPAIEGLNTYRTLGSGAAAQANAVVMFEPGTTEQEIRRALRASGARLVDGPTASNAYLLSLSGEDHAGAIARLRAQPGVSLAESLDARPAP